MLRKIGIAVLCMSLLCGCAGGNSFSIVDTAESREYADPAGFYQSDEYIEWRREHFELSEAAREAASRQLSFAKETAIRFLSAGEKENRVYAPLNAWFALAALTACTSGNTKQELLGLLQVEDDQQLLNDYEALWQAAAVDLPEAQEENAVSLWLSSRHSFLQDKLQLMQQQYHLSSYAGNLGSNKVKKEFQNWINDHTGGLLSDYVSDLRPDKDTVMSLVSALNYKAAWDNAFDQRDTELQLFYGLNNESVVYLMRIMEEGQYYRGSNFAAVRKKLKDTGYMYLVLPNQGADLTDVYEQDEMWQMLEGTTFSDSSEDAMLFIDLPIFDVSVKDDLSDLLKGLGVNAVFDGEKADFSAISDEKNLYLSKAEHAAMVSVNEDGVAGAAYTEMEVTAGSGIYMGGKESFEARRPFLFIITGDDGTVQFIGTIYDLPDVEVQWNGQFPGVVEGVDADHTAVLPQGTIHYYLPEGMESEIRENGELYIYVADDPGRGETFAFDKILDCGTGLYAETRKVNGRYVTLYSPSTQSWHYAVFSGRNKEPDLVIISGLGIKYRDMADQILHSIHIEY